MAFTLALGAKAPDFTLPGIDGITYWQPVFSHLWNSSNIQRRP